MKQSRVGKKALAIALLGALGTGNALAQSLDASETTAVINQVDHNASVVFTNTAPASVGAFDFELTYNAGNLTIATGDISTDHAGTFCSVPAAGTILCFSNPTVGLTLPDSVTITLLFDVGATEQVEPLTFGAVNMFDSGGGGVSPTLDDGQIDVQTAPPDANLVYAPASGSTITFGGGTSGDVVTSAITVTAAGTTGSGSVTGCTLGGANPGAFAVTSVFPVTATVGGPGGSIDLECTLDNAASTATLSCTETDSSVSNPTWDLSCPAGTPIPAPEFDSTPAPGGTINCSGAPDSVQNRTLTIDNIGDLPLTVSSCTTADAGFTVTGPAFPQVIAAGGSIDVGIQCTVPSDGVPAITGDLTCTSDDSNEGTVTYGLIAGPVTVPPANPAPAIIPANSLWSLLALFGVIAGIGAVVVGVRRH